ncbi:helix-turn-helix domain-containing protein, partial [Streptomyces rubrogriseus]
MAGDDFAALLRELKERSGLSYGALGKRLHMSGSTLHRYVSGEVVPVEFAPVERLARVCRATPDELLELHRRWIRADALRGVKKDETEGAEGSDGGETAEGAAADSAASARAPSAAPPVPDTTPVPATPVPAAPVMATPVPVTPDATPAPGSVPPARDASGPARRRVPRAALYAATGVV